MFRKKNDSFMILVKEQQGRPYSGPSIGVGSTPVGFSSREMGLNSEYNKENWGLTAEEQSRGQRMENCSEEALGIWESH